MRIRSIRRHNISVQHCLYSVNSSRIDYIIIYLICPPIWCVSTRVSLTHLPTRRVPHVTYVVIYTCVNRLRDPEMEWHTRVNRPCRISLPAIVCQVCSSRVACLHTGCCMKSKYEVFPGVRRVLCQVCVKIISSSAIGCMNVELDRVSPMRFLLPSIILPVVPLVLRCARPCSIHSPLSLFRRYRRATAPSRVWSPCAYVRGK